MQSRIINNVLWLSIFAGLINILFKCFFITDSGYWYDEICSVYNAQKELIGIKNYATWDINPPFYNYILHYWMKLFGISEVATRSLSLMFNGIGAGLLFYFSKKYFNLTTAIFASILYFGNNEIFYYAQETRTYSLNLVFVIISGILFFEMLKQPNWLYTILLGLINWAAIYSHYLFAVIPFFQGVTLIIFWRKDKIIHFLSAGVITLLIFNKWIFRIIEVLQRGGNPRMQKENTILDLFDTFFQLVNGESNTILIIIIIALGVYFLFKGKSISFLDRQKVVYMFLSSIGFIVILFIMGSNSAVFITRYLLFSLIGLFVLGGYMFSIIPIDNTKKYIILGLMLFLNLSYINYYVKKPMNFKDAVAYIKEINTDKTLILVQTQSVSDNFTYYFDNEVFKKGKQVPISLIERNVIIINDLSDLYKLDFSAYNKIILSQTFKKFKSSEFSELLKNKEIKFLNRKLYKSVDVRVFSNEANYNSKNKTISQLHKENPQLTIKMHMDRIRKISSWMKQIEKKALQRKISTDSMLYLDAVWYMNK